MKVRKVLSMLLVFAVAITFLPAIPKKNVQAASKEYYIYTVEDLYCVRNDMNGTYYLMNDLDLTKTTGKNGDYDYMGNGWDPIGSEYIYSNSKFNGLFEGNGHTISGMRIEFTNKPKDANNRIYIGLFAKNNGIIRNLNVNCNISVSQGNQGIVFIGAIAGITNGVIENCNVSGKINITDGNNTTERGDIACGGLVGSDYDYNSSIYDIEHNSIISCSNNAKITVETEQIKRFRIGGIIGLSSISGAWSNDSQNSIELEYCANKGEIDINHNVSKEDKDYCVVGGIMGDGGSSPKITECFNQGKINVLWLNNNHHSYGKHGEDSVAIGGIVGVVRNKSTCIKTEINNSYSSGSILGTVTKETFERNVKLGGIVGKSDEYEKGILIKNCYNAGTVQKDYDGNISLGKAVIDSEDISATGCYYLQDTGEDDFGCASVSSSQLMNQSILTQLDFSKVWIIDLYTEYKYPQIKNNRQDAETIVDNIEILSNPTRLCYYVGDILDLSGGKVKIYYADGSSKILDMTEEMICYSSGNRMYIDTTKTGTYSFHIKIGKSSVIKYSGATIKIVERPAVTAMTLLSEPTQKEFVKGTFFDFSGCKVQVAYANGDIEIKDITPDMTTGGNINNIGNQTIRYKLDSKSVSFVVEVVPVQVSSISILSKPKKTRYLEGDSFNMSGLKIQATYTNGTTREIEEYTISGYSSEPGIHQITVEYSGCTAVFDVKVIAKKLTSIKVTRNPQKTIYIQGQLIDTTGMEVTATYDNGTTDIITDYTVDEPTMETGLQTVAVRYGDVETYIPITVTARQVELLKILNPPNQTTYIEQTEFKPDGLVVQATYNSGITEEVTDYEISDTSTNLIGEKVITVTYGGESASFIIHVIPKSLESISVCAPDKKSYLIGEKFDKSGMIVIANYDNKTSEEVTNYEVSGFSGEVGSNLITVSYQNKRANFYVTVHQPEDLWEVVEKPDCEHEGKRVKHCTHCGEVVVEEKIDALGHTVVIDASVDSTCTETGLTEGSHCSECNKILKEQEVIPAKGHVIPEMWTIITNPMCIENGLQEKRCIVCGEVVNTNVIEAHGHHIVVDKAVDAICTKSGLTEGTHCDICNQILVAQTMVEPLGHTPEEEWSIITKPTCTKKGKRVKYCTVCDELLEEETIDELGHSFVKYHSDNNATCTDDGTKTAKCERCEETNTIVDEGSKLGHHLVLDKAVPASCIESGLSEGTHCDRCNKMITPQEVVAPKGHHASEKWITQKEATCTDKGIEVQKCIECDEVLDARKIEEIDHVFKNYFSDNNATCIQDGTKTAKCEYCVATDTKVDFGTKLQHHRIIVNASSPTYLHDGYIGDEMCSMCGQIISYGNGYILKYTLRRPFVRIKAKKRVDIKIVTLDRGITYFEYRIKIGKKWKQYKKISEKLTLKKLKKGKKYKVKVRTIVVEEGKKIYSPWSSVKKFKVK